MRVTLLSKALVVGAYQRKCELIAENNDIELTVLVPPAWRTGKRYDRLERLYTDGYDLRVLPLRMNGSFHLHYYPALARELARLRPDILHIDEEPYNLATYLALRAAQACHAKTVVFSWQNILRQYPPPFRWMEHYVLAHVDSLIAGSASARTVMRAKGYQSDAPVIPQFGVDTEVFLPKTRTKKGDGNTPFTIGYAGRLVREKGIDVILQALAGLPEQIHAVIVGAGDQAEPLHMVAEKLHIGERVRFLPPVPSAQMPDVYSNLDVLVLPSRSQPNWKEQFGRVLIEAMACGIPVIGSRCGEIPNVIADAGLIFDEDDVAGLRDCIMQLFNQPALREGLALRGRARVMAHYSMRQVASETVAVYRSMRS
ncbi:MAG: glycosyltransferase family 4 protein [Chloroflexi bacterium]|nr:glycosyltransferase family 4 protein [Chloroflexota bacterium]MCL5275923.1 glycosyltransferase family 4 protein [Chloroflexota bacterium]